MEESANTTIKVVTGLAEFKKDIGNKISIMYSECTEDGVYLKQNVQTSRILVDNEKNKAVNDAIEVIRNYAQGVIESIKD